MPGNGDVTWTSGNGKVPVSRTGSTVLSKVMYRKIRLRNNLVNLIVSFSGAREDRQSDTETDSRLQAFERIKELRSVPIDGEKAVLQEYREEMCAY